VQRSCILFLLHLERRLLAPSLFVLHPRYASLPFFSLPTRLPLLQGVDSFPPLFFGNDRARPSSSQFPLPLVNLVAQISMPPRLEMASLLLCFFPPAGSFCSSQALPSATLEVKFGLSIIPYEIWQPSAACAPSAPIVSLKVRRRLYYY